MKKFELEPIPETKPAIEVGNEVIWSNHEIEFPFSVRRGEGTKLGVFLTNEGAEPTLNMAVDDKHHRSGLVGEIIIGDAQKNIYHFVDLKGIGFVGMPVGGEKITVAPPAKQRLGRGTWGTWREDLAIRERDITEELVHEGVRTYRIGALIRLKEIALPDGKKISIEEAEKNGIIAPNENPIVGVRLYRMRERVIHDNERSREYLQKAKDVVEGELNKELTWDSYAEWFAATLGENLAKIHKSGYWHGYLSNHNVTLACEIVDFGFGEGNKRLSDLDEGEAHQKVAFDKDEAKTVVLMSLQSTLSKQGLSGITQGRLNELFEEAYTKALPIKGATPK